MANIFKLTKEYVDAPKRNVYDLSYTTNLTAKFGLLYPVFIKETNPGDSFSIGTNFGLRAEPMVFPVQSAIRADIHYFYVRNRTLWEHWMDFYGKLDDTLVHPYLVQPNDFYKSKTLADYIGVPTSFVGTKLKPVVMAANPYSWTGYSVGDPSSINPVYSATQSSLPLSIESSLNEAYIKIEEDFNRVRGRYVPSLPLVNMNTTSVPAFSSWRYFMSVGNNGLNYESLGVMTPRNSIDFYLDAFNNLAGSPSVAGSTTSPLFLKYLNYISAVNPSEFDYSFYPAGSARLFFYHGDDIYNAHTITSARFSFYVQIEPSYIGIGFYLNVDNDFELSSIISYIKEAKRLGYDNMYIMFGFSGSREDNLRLLSSPNIEPMTEGYCSLGNVVEFPTASTESSFDASDIGTVVFSGSNPLLKINALPFRAYEAIYNSYYRNYMNDPFILNGKPQYNRYVTSLSSGADSTPYKLQKRNWELDFLTSAVQSPQQGEAPLIGITVSNSDSTATFKFRSEELENLGVANGEVTANVTVSDDGTMVGMNYVDPRLPQSNIDRLMEAINYGISINDIRNVNSLQRWLEKNIRRGYRYIDQLKSHFGVDVSYKDLLMPEFIGGCSFKIDTNTISQTTPTSDSPLGAYGGQAFARGNSEHNVTKYCDEAGFIIGIMSIVPTPVYSQVPNQFLFRENLLDYYFPEFGKIPMQPIYKRDIAPLQTESDKMYEVFGYQRPWWHLISSVDEVHGEFRTTRQGYLIQRLFKDTPMLNGDFLTIDNSSINNVFYVDDTVSDQFLGQIHFNVSKKTAIPLHGIPQID